ncbi:hypothetical protein [Parasphingorhabdus pacifica]
MFTGSDLLFVLLGLLIVIVDGQLIRRSGTTYLKSVYPNPKVADSVNQLITVLFHLSALGIFALIAVLELTFTGPTESLVARLGVLCLVLAVAHGIVVWILTRLQSRQRERVLQDELAARTEQRLAEKEDAPDPEGS